MFKGVVTVKSAELRVVTPEGSVYCPTFKPPMLARWVIFRPAPDPPSELSVKSGPLEGAGGTLALLSAKVLIVL